MTSTSKINPSAVGPTSPSIGLKTVTFTSQVFRDQEDFEAHRTAGTLCDLELRSYVQPVVRAHKIILLTRNSYFSKHFAAQPDCSHIDIIPPLNAAFVELLIKFIYTGKLEVPITPKDFTQLIITATHFEVDELDAQQCSAVLARNISTSTLWQIRKIAQELSINSLDAQVQAWIELNFATVLSSDEFLSLELEDVLYLVENTVRERIKSFQVIILQGILHWVERAEEDRNRMLHELLKRVDLEEIFDNSPEVLYDAFRAGSLLDTDPNCSEMFNNLCRKKALEYSLKLRQTEEQEEAPKRLIASNPSSSSTANLMSEEQITSSNLPPSPDSTLIHRAQNQSVADPVKSQSSRRNRACRESSKAKGIPVKKPKTSLPLSFKDHFDSIGSRSEKFDPDMRLLNYHRRGTSSMTAYNFHTSTLETLCEVPQVRYLSSLVATEDHIFHIGGSYDRFGRSVKDTKVYSRHSPTKIKGWNGPDLCSPVSSAASCRLNNSIYVIGGNALASDDGAGNVRSTTQSLDLSKSANKEWKWELKGCMVHARDSFDVSVFDGNIYAVGGFGITSKLQQFTRPLNSFEYYSPVADRWYLHSQSQYMQTPRAYHKVCVLGTKMYAVGGVTYDSNRTRNELVLNTVEVYDFCHPGRWVSTSPMNEKRYAGAVFPRNGLIYAVGGNDNPRQQNAEVYDPRTNGWTPLEWPTGLPQASGEDMGTGGHENDVIDDSYEAAILLP